MKRWKHFQGEECHVSSALLLKDNSDGCREEGFDGDEFGRKEILFSIVNTNSVSCSPCGHCDLIILPPSLALFPAPDIHGTGSLFSSAWF